MAIIFSVALKLLLFFAFPAFALGGGSDANYYHAYAVGEFDFAVNSWPIILRFISDAGFYSRGFISFVLICISVTALPVVFSRLVAKKGYARDLKNRNLAFFLVICYPTIFIYSLDIYRDIVMFLVWCVAALFAKRFYESRGAERNIFLIIFFAFAFIAFLFRGYLGFSLFIAPLIVRIYKIAKPKNWKVFFIYLFALVVAQASGYLDPIFEYRGEDGFEDGGSSLGFGLLNKNPLEFVALYFLSFAAQVFGLFVPNISSAFVFLFESLPFIFAFRYVLKNLKYCDDFCYFLLIFFLIYTSIWIIGNDNLGTAVRLRVPSYLSVFACFFILRARKALASLGNIPAHARTQSMSNAFLVTSRRGE